MRNGYGRYVYNAAANASFASMASQQMSGKGPALIVVEEGEWVDDEFKGEPREVSGTDYATLLQAPLK